MASSSIEVMGVGMGTEGMKMMLLEDDVHDEEMAKRMQDIIENTGPPGHIINTGSSISDPTSSSPGEDFPSMNQFSNIDGMEPPPGTIIFSPQDLMRNTKPPTRGRGRGRGCGVAAIKQEPSNQELEVPVTCEICHKVMMTGKTLVQHMAIHSDLKPFQCPHCPKSFARKVHLQGHLVVHGIEKQFECPVCHQRFSRQDCVKVHMRLHDKSKCVYCDVCHKAFLTIGALNIHLRIHRGEKPFKCHLCSKCFTQKNHLITHIKRHTKVADEHFTKKLGPRMFKCEHCTRAFIRLSDYERHVQWNHGAVADGSIIDKLPTVSNLVDGEMKQTGLAPLIFKAPKDAINSSKPRGKRGKRVMCTASTQTDEDGGHVIIPRIYQTQVSAATQVSAPPTPRPADDDMYENDIFDEGMDRNYSSDEDDPDEVEMNEEKKTYTVSGSSDVASDPVQDAAFDAIVQGSSSKPQPIISAEAADVNSSASDQHAVFLQEVVSSMSKQGLDVRNPEENEDQNLPPEVEKMEISAPETRVDPPQDSTILMTLNAEELETSQGETTANEGMTDDLGNRIFDKPDFEFGPQVRGKGRGRGRGRGSRGGKKHYFGLTGAAELRFMRRTMMQSILNATAEEKESENNSQDVVKPAEVGGVKGDEIEDGKVTATEEGETEIRTKRMAKKQHGKDFVCNMKNCETCLPSQKPNSKVQAKVKVKLKENDNAETGPAKKVFAVPESRNSPRPLAKTPVSRDSPKPQTKSSKSWINTNASIIPGVQKLKEKYEPQNVRMDLGKKRDDTTEYKGDQDEPKMKVVNRVGTYPVEITANLLTQKSDYFVTSSSADNNIVSPPVELMSFCIPTYSCKLCGREFRFEGKLHRHIESVHQNKAIFSADVKPGRGSSRFTGEVSSKIIKLDPTPVPVSPQILSEPENPEIAALRSEWSDDDDDDDNEDGDVTAAATTITNVSSIPIQQSIGHPLTIVTRDITPVTATVSGSLYSSGVKVNMNKLAGLLPQNKEYSITSDTTTLQSSAPRMSATVAPSLAPREPETIMADTLDMKCRRLLEKLFDHDLLLSCGLLEEHVSVVLGRVLQHYGVKMIEDYGQGQYEVLKYNLWRLIEWKVTMEQMEEFYTAGKSVEEMMDDIMNERVPLVSHHFVPHEQKAQPPPPVSQAGQVTQVETVEMTEGQMVLQQVAGVLGGQLNLPEGVTQVVLAQDVSPDLLQGAHIVTIDPTTGQVISQVTADQVILTDSISEELEQQVAALDGQVVVSQPQLTAHNASQASIVVPQSSSITVHGNQGQASHGQMVVHTIPHQQQQVKLETQSHSTAQHHPHHQQ